MRLTRVWPAVDNRFSRGTTAALRSWLLTSGPYLFVFVNLFHARHVREFLGLEERRILHFLLSRPEERRTSHFLLLSNSLSANDHQLLSAILKYLRTCLA